ncbi:Aspartate--tRNA(Asp/Asn) ligase [Nitrosopumilaceae archaeon]|nr:aspartate--tRNA(Asn) ligase [Nitrosopumilus sp.]CAI9831309.1 Aspartate--tRNA(Asp/Asn) ligase [Nitrosopumilaceae archaeon]MDA7944314.1 aspartate--tRNA(Asn) ligase [Nitrosopumilus sp.]MDA7954066.1 aspartate--tRNA(Asn) ligase [Nitrosopumilus sp.]MDA7959588.1 aspartate--tRNA(Asn) ligase [Nitrosopumilus sp.]
MEGRARTSIGRITAGMDGQEAAVAGWVVTVRAHGAISFATISDSTGEILLVAKRGECADGLVSQVASLRPHTSVSARGVIRSSSKAPGGREMAPSGLDVLSEASRAPPFEPTALTVRNIDTRLGARYIDMRRPPVRHVFLARARALSAVRRYLEGEDFVEVSTPKLISSATEGGAALFAIFFYDKQAFLAQSPQLYKEQLVMGLDRVYEIGPIFRAEASRTPRHLAEAVSIDIEESFAGYGEAMSRAEGVVRAAAGAVAEHAAENPSSGITPPEIGVIPRHTYSEMIERVRAAGAGAEWGDDLYPSHLKKAGMEGFYFVTDWPLAPKPFYVRGSPGDPRTSESFDLMYGDLEVSSGSSRISCRADLERRLADKGLDPAAFGHHLGAFDYGMPPHAGFGIGLERLMMALTGSQNIRDVALYPRDVDRLVP